MRKRIPPCYSILIPIIGMAISVAGTALQSYQQSQQLNYQAKLQSAINNTQQGQVNKTLNVEYATANLQRSQEVRAAATKNFETTVSSMKAKGEARAALASTGLSGLSMDNILHEYDMAKSAQFNRTSQNLKFSSEGIDASNAATYLNAQTSLTGQPVPQPANMNSYLAGGLSIGGALASGAADIYKWKN